MESRRAGVTASRRRPEPRLGRHVLVWTVAGRAAPERGVWACPRFKSKPGSRSFLRTETSQHCPIGGLALRVGSFQGVQLLPLPTATPPGEIGAPRPGPGHDARVTPPASPVAVSLTRPHPTPGWHPGSVGGGQPGPRSVTTGHGNYELSAPLGRVNRRARSWSGPVKGELFHGVKFLPGLALPDKQGVGQGWPRRSRRESPKTSRGARGASLQIYCQGAIYLQKPV